MGDHLLTLIRAPAYLALYPQDLMAWVLTLPDWMTGLWALAVWSGLLGAVMLVARVGRSALVLGVAALAMAAFTLSLLIVADPPIQVVGGALGVAMMLGTTAVQGLIWVYARAMHARGYLP